MHILLLTAAVMLLVLSVVQFSLTSNGISGAGSLVIGLSLIAVASSTRKKINNG
jgi:hypothetical protein